MCRSSSPPVTGGLLSCRLLLLPLLFLLFPLLLLLLLHHLVFRFLVCFLSCSVISPFHVHTCKCVSYIHSLQHSRSNSCVRMFDLCFASQSVPLAALLPVLVCVEDCFTEQWQAAHAIAQDSLMGYALQNLLIACAFRCVHACAKACCERFLALLHKSNLLLPLKTLKIVCIRYDKPARGLA